jgi:hypothetical protein
MGELITLEQALNSKSEKLNARINALNVHLAGVFVECWLIHDPLEATRQRRDHSGSLPRVVEHTTVFGYGNHCDWQLMIRETMTEYEGSHRYEKAVSYKPLLQASRDIRLKAAERFDELLNLLRITIQSRLDLIRKAEEFWMRQ